MPKLSIIVVAFDSIATAPCEYDLYNSFAGDGTGLATEVAERANGRANGKATSLSRAASRALAQTRPAPTHPWLS
jgi:hypothetical protein